MSFMSTLRSVGSALVAGAKACVGIPTVNAEPVSKEDEDAYVHEFFDHPLRYCDRQPARGLRSERKLPTIDNAKHEYSTTASRREAQRKLDAKRMVHVSVPVTEQGRFAVSVLGERAWNYLIRDKGKTYHKSVVL